MQKRSDLSAVQKSMVIGFRAKRPTMAAEMRSGELTSYRSATDHPDERKGYQRCLPNNCSANVAPFGPPPQMPGSYTYVDCCSLATQAGICTLVPRLNVH
ncbi:hypothetical protein HPB52_015874 [Rhipicephalus sanguineus]|uniref:Uncharacterized protein n=1 Tax=Rhipicephalus sanguineus TaxID=34632 RepID=A0A9D4QBA6_RHISA|nr:hypothetical protein HPB52_015874 [Rhipicephalus sanguineus]